MVVGNLNPTTLISDGVALNGGDKEGAQPAVLDRELERDPALVGRKSQGTNRVLRMPNPEIGALTRLNIERQPSNRRT